MMLAGKAALGGCGVPLPPWVNPSPSGRAQWAGWEMLPAYGRCPAGQVPPGQHPQPGQGWRMLWPRRGHPHSPQPDLEVLLCRAAGLPEQQGGSTGGRPLHKHGAHRTAAAPEKPSSHARIYRKSLHESINSSPTDAAGNASPVRGELREMELTPTPAPSPPRRVPPVRLLSTQQLCSTLEEPLPWPEASPACLCLLCLPAEPGSRTHGDPSSKLGARASLLRFWDWERGWGG